MRRQKVIALRQLSPPFVGTATSGAAGEAQHRRRPAPATLPVRHEEDNRLHFHRQSNAIKYAALLFYLPAFVVLGLIIAD